MRKSFLCKHLKPRVCSTKLVVSLVFFKNNTEWSPLTWSGRSNDCWLWGAGGGHCFHQGVCLGYSRGGEGLGGGQVVLLELEEIGVGGGHCSPADLQGVGAGAD